MEEIFDLLFGEEEAEEEKESPHALGEGSTEEFLADCAFQIVSSVATSFFFGDLF